MKLLFDLFPIILFYAAFKLADIYVATTVAIVGTIGQVLWLKLRRRTVDPMLWVSLGLIVVFGGATLILHDETFIKWKPTVLYWLFAASFLVSDLFFKKNLVRAMMRGQLALPDPIWRRLNYAWVVFFIAMGCANIYVARNFSTDNWVSFKLYGTLVLMVVFIVVQGLMLSKHIQEEQD